MSLTPPVDPTPLADTPALAYWLEAPGRGRLRTEPLPAAVEGDVRVRTLHSGISRGTECLIHRGEVPASEYQRMRAPWQQGEFPGPVKYGYSSVGVIEAGPPALVGRPVFCLFPHQDRYVVPQRAVHPLPAGVPPARAVLAANVETAVNAIWDGTPRPGDRVTVVGGGVLGLLCAWLAARVPGCEVQVVDVDAARGPVAARLGARFALPGQADGDADLVFHASAHPEGLATALQLAGFEARVIELSWYGSRPVDVPLGGAFHARRLSLLSSQVGTVATAQRARWDHARRMALALRLLADARLDALIDHDHDFSDLPRVMADLAQGAPGLCHRINYPDDSPR